MKAVVYRSYGSPDVLRVEEVEKPELTEDGVLVRAHGSLTVYERDGSYQIVVRRMEEGEL